MHINHYTSDKREEPAPHLARHFAVSNHRIEAQPSSRLWRRIRNYFFSKHAGPAPYLATRLPASNNNREAQPSPRLWRRIRNYFFSKHAGPAPYLATRLPASNNNREAQPSSRLSGGFKNHFFGQGAGFTLVEVTIVAGIIITGMVAVQTAVQYGLRASVASTDGIVAAHLAEEGLELVRNIRDTNWAKEAGGAPGGYTKWTNLADGDYLVHYLLTSPAAGSPPPPLCKLGSAGCPATAPPLDFNATSGLYGYNGWGTFTGSSSRFTRIVNIAHPNLATTDEYIIVTSTVTWSDSMGPHQMSIVEHLYDWRP